MDFIAYFCCLARSFLCFSINQWGLPVRPYLHHRVKAPRSPKSTVKRSVTRTVCPTPSVTRTLNTCPAPWRQSTGRLPSSSLTRTHSHSRAHRLIRYVFLFTGYWKQWAGRSTQKTTTTSCLWQRTSWESSRLKLNRWALWTNLQPFPSWFHWGGLTVGFFSRSWRGTACKGTELCRGSGVLPSTSPPGGVWQRPMWRKAPSQKPVAAARPQTTTTTASNLNVALWNKKKQPTQHPSKTPLPLSSSF